MRKMTESEKNEIVNTLAAISNNLECVKQFDGITDNIIATISKANIKINDAIVLAATSMTKEKMTLDGVGLGAKIKK